MKTLIIALLMTSATALASTHGFDLKMDLSLNGKHVSSPHVITEDGKTATIIQKTDPNKAEQTFIEIVATEEAPAHNKGISIKFVIGTIDANGVRKETNRPQFVVNENEPAQITVGDHSKTPDLDLSVVAKRKSL